MKTSPLKVTLSVLALFVLLFNPLFCQQKYWSSAVALTDSVSDNTNPSIRILDFSETSGFYLFWEKSTDTLSTAIYYKNFYEADEAHIFISTQGVHYTNPQPVDSRTYQSEDTLFYVFYETDEEGYNNIYYRIYNQSGFTDPKALTESAEEKTDLQCNNFGRIVWKEQNRIMHARLDIYTHLIEDIAVIDSGNCSFPSVIRADNEWMGYDVPAVAWIKEVNDSSRVMIRKYSEQSGWLDPEVVFTGPQCQNLSFCTGIGSPETLTWDYFNDTSWHIVFHDFWGEEEYITEFDQEYPFHPKFYSGIIPVNSKYFEAGMCSLIFRSNDTTAIYTSPFYYGVFAPIDDYQHVSEPGNFVRNPQIFSGKTIGCNQYFINIWEEQVNNHWQLKYVTAYECLSKVEENDEPTGPGFRISPNPFSQQTIVSFSLDRATDVNLTVRDLSGKLISTIFSGRLHTGQYNYTWSCVSCSPGLYIVTLQSNSIRKSEKLILSR